MDNRSTRLTAVIAAVVAVLAVGALIATTYLNIGAHEAATSTGTTSNPVDGTPAPGDPLEPSVSASPSSPNDPTDDGHDVEEEYTPDAKTTAAIRSVARRFVDAWKTPGTPTERTQSIGPLATEYLTRLLARVDPLDLPTTAKIVGDPKIVAATPYAAGAEVKLNNGWTLRVNLLLDTTGWRVNEILPPDQAAQPSPTDKGNLDGQDATPPPTTKTTPPSKPGAASATHRGLAPAPTPPAATPPAATAPATPAAVTPSVAATWPTAAHAAQPATTTTPIAAAPTTATPPAATTRPAAAHAATAPATVIPATVIPAALVPAALVPAAHVPTAPAAVTPSATATRPAAAHAAQPATATTPVPATGEVT